MEGYRFSLVEKTLTITKAFEEAVIRGNGPEYDLYMRLMEDHPGLTVIRKTHKSPKKYTNKKGETFNCNQFKNLKYENMEKFIRAIPNSEEFMKEYTFIKDYASAIQTNGYALVRRWFEAQFPLYRSNPMFYLYNTPKVINIYKEAEQEAEENNVA